MIRQRLVVVVALLAAIAAGAVGTLHSAGAATGTADKLVFSPNPIALAGSLAASATQAITVTATIGGAADNPAMVFLSFTQATGGGSATAGAGNTPLTASPVGFPTDASGVVNILYTAPATLPTTGHDSVIAQNLASSATVTKPDAYVFSPLASYAWSVGPPIAPTGTLAASHSVTFTVTAEDGANHGIAGAAISLSLTTTASTGGSAIGTDTGGPSPIGTTPSRFLADTAGAVSITYTTPSSLPSGGVDTLTAQDHPTATHSANTTYTFGPITTPPPSPPHFAPQGVGAPQVAVTPDGSQQLVFWKGSNNILAEAWYALGHWNGPITFPQLGTIASTPSVAVTKDGSQQLVFWQGANGHLLEGWYALGAWHGPVDWTASFGGVGLLASSPSVVTTTDGQQLVFWRGTDSHLWEAWYSGGSWHGPADFTTLGTLASAPSAAILPNGTQQLVFWQGTDNRLTEVWYAHSWNGPAEFPAAGSITSPPSVTVTTDGSTQLVFFRSPAGHLLESWYAGSWNGPVDFTASAFGGNGPLTSSPSATVTPDGSTQLVFWQGAGSSLWEGWYTGGAWHGPVDFSAG